MSGKPKNRGWNLAFASLITLEASFVFYMHKGSLPNPVNEAGLFLSSLLIGLLVLVRYYGKKVVPISESKSWLRKECFLPIGILSLGFLLFIFVCARLFQEMPVDPKWSDIIPTIQVAVERLLHGERVYATIYMHSHTLPLTYLPMQWLPFTLAGWLQFDFRWIAVGIFCIACYVMVWRVAVQSALHALFITALLLLCGWMMMVNDSGPVTTTVELMVAGYYMLLITGLGGKNAWLCGIAISLCLLSRYSLALWLPLWAMATFISGERKFLFRASIVIGASVILIYVVPFLSRDWSYWWQGYQYYSKAAVGEWSHLDQNGIPFQLNHGIGFARIFFEKLASKNVAEKILVLQRVQVLALLFSVAIMGLWYWRKHNMISLRPFLLGSFKIYLSLFFAFIQVPHADRCCCVYCSVC